MNSETPKTDKAPKFRGGVRFERVSAAHARRLEEEMNGYKKALESIAFGGLSENEMEHQARKALGVFTDKEKIS
jgi:hypothetical protein